jgi:hypothetical protein
MNIEYTSISKIGKLDLGKIPEKETALQDF